MERNFCGIQYTACPDTGKITTTNLLCVRQDGLHDCSGYERKDKDYGVSPAVLTVVNIEVRILWDRESQ
jgi:hypothetical protein